MRSNKKKFYVYVLYYTTKTSDTTGKFVYSINHYKYFVYKDDLAKFLTQQDGNFFPLCIQRLNVANSMVIDKNYNVITNVFKKGGEQ